MGSIESPEEKAHWKSVLKAYDGYMQYHLSANHARRMAFLALPRSSRDIYEELGYREKLDAVDEGIRRNAEFLDEMIADPVFAEVLKETTPAGDTEQSVVDESSVSGSFHPGANASASGSHSLSHSPPDRQEPSNGTNLDSHTHSHSLSHSHSQSHAHSQSHSHSHSSSPAPTPGRSTSTPQPNERHSERHVAQDKVRSTLRSFVRDWSAAGNVEREACYAPCLDALKRYFPESNRVLDEIEAEKEEEEEEELELENQNTSSSTRMRRWRKGREGVRVLVPGCGLGRLAMEIAALGFDSQGNEFSTFMLLASNWVLNQTTHANSHFIHPFLHSFSNHLSTSDLLRAVPVPDVCPADVLGGGQGGGFSLVAGDFQEVYGVALNEEEDGKEAEQRGRWGAVVTCFFLDCARNVLTFLRIIHALLEEDGVWINIGPLLWHFENSSNSTSGEGSIELSLDEVKHLARKIGFDIHDERMVRTTYTGIPGNMLKHEYQAAFWTATKRKST